MPRCFVKLLIRASSAVCKNGVGIKQSYDARTNASRCEKGDRDATVRFTYELRGPFVNVAQYEIKIRTNLFVVRT